MTRTLFLAVLLAGCGQPDDLGGQDFWLENSPADVESELTVTMDDAETAAFDADGQETDDSVVGVCDTQDTGADGFPTEALDVSADGGSLDVLHTGYIADCCATWDVIVEVSEWGLDFAYENTAEDTCGCDCDHAIGYTVDGVPAGTWTVSAGDQSVEVVVE